MLWIGSLILLFLLFLYILTIIYLLNKQVVPGAYTSKGRIKLREKNFPDIESVKEYEKKLNEDPKNVELKAEILFAFLLHEEWPKLKSRQYALWFLENMPLHSINQIEGQQAILMSPTSEDDGKILKEQVISIWEKHLESKSDNLHLLLAAATCTTTLDQVFSESCWRRFQQIFPYSASALEKLANFKYFDLPREKKTSHPIPELREAFRLKKKRLNWPWSAHASSQLEQLQMKFKIIPNPICFVVLYIHAFMNPNNRPWQHAYFISGVGMMAYHVGEYEFAKKCSEQFLKLQPAAQKAHNHLPLYSTGFSLAAILALKEKNMERLSYFLDKKAEIPATSEFDFMFHDTQILIELVRDGHKDIAVRFMEKRANQGFPIAPKIQAEIDFVKSGKMPFSEEYYNRSSN